MQKECAFKSKHPLTTNIGLLRSGQPKNLKNQVVYQFHRYDSERTEADTTALQPVVFQFHSYDSEREVSKSSYIPISREVEAPPAKA